MFKRVLQMAAVLAITVIGVQSSEAGHRHHRRGQSCGGSSYAAVQCCAPAPVVECCAPVQQPMPQPAPPQQPPMPPQQQPMPPQQQPMPPQAPPTAMIGQGCGAPGCGAPVMNSSACCAPAPTCCDAPVDPCATGCGSGGRRHHGLFGHHHRRGASACCGEPVAMAGCCY